MMMRGTSSPYTIGESDFYCGEPMTACPYDMDEDQNAYLDWQEGWANAFKCFVLDMEEVSNGSNSQSE